LGLWLQINSGISFYADYRETAEKWGGDAEDDLKHDEHAVSEKIYIGKSNRKSYVSLFSQSLNQYINVRQNLIRELAN